MPTIRPGARMAESVWETLQTTRATRGVVEYPKVAVSFLATGVESGLRGANVPAGATESDAATAPNRKVRDVRATIKEKREVAKGTLFVTFDLENEGVDFRPGQYFFVTLPDVGHQDEKGLRRHISVVTSPNEKGTRPRHENADTAFKEHSPSWVAPRSTSSRLKFMLPADTSRPLVFVAGGIGITVFRSMLRYIAEDHRPYRVTLIYSNRDRESTAFLDELGARTPGGRLRSS